MKKILILLLIPFLFSACSSLSAKTKGLLNQPAPISRLVLDDGTYSTTEAYQGKNLALMFWTTVCHHSENKIIDFDEYAENFKNRSKVDFVAINIDSFEKLDSARAYVQEHKLTHLTHAYSGNDIQDEAFLNFNGDTVPLFIVIDKQGIIRVVSLSLGDVESYLENHSSK